MTQRPRTSFASRHPIWTTLAALFVLGLVIEYWWLIVGAIVLAALGYVAFRAWQRHCEQVAVRARAEAALAARADEQHQQYLSGEEHGLYGNYRPAPLD
ncbi:hypothetical protein P9990_17465 [Prescottella equi]|uniref:hypothetical protein n=1 Tax=Rhodococcus hoagii TaxID=43767 RepID=UPI0025789D9F|nr:hypothetical protein [Prescottella equi]WJJ10360.1 hypothetical protein P9990_17465 [Prescottella equi]